MSMGGSKLISLENIKRNRLNNNMIVLLTIEELYANTNSQILDPFYAFYLPINQTYQHTIKIRKHIQIPTTN